MGTLEPFIETALTWSGMITDYRSSDDLLDKSAEIPLDEWKVQGMGNFHIMQV